MRSWITDHATHCVQVKQENQKILFRRPNWRTLDQLSCRQAKVKIYFGLCHIPLSQDKTLEFIQRARNEKITNRALCDSPTFAGLSDEHQRNLEAIAAQENGITFSDLCSDLNMKTAELQRSLGSSTLAWRSKTGSDERPWTVKNKKYINRRTNKISTTNEKAEKRISKCLCKMDN